MNIWELNRNSNSVHFNGKVVGGLKKAIERPTMLKMVFTNFEVVVYKPAFRVIHRGEKNSGGRSGSKPNLPVGDGAGEGSAEERRGSQVSGASGVNPD